MTELAAPSYEWLGGERHRHAGVEHAHPHSGAHAHGAARPHRHEDASHSHSHGHSHGLVDDSIKRSRAGIRAVAWSLAILALGALLQTAIYATTGSVALLADLVHNFGDALTAVPLAIAFALRSQLAERRAGLAVVAAIFISACVAAVEAVHRLIDPSPPGHLLVLAAAGAIGCVANLLAARVRLAAGRRLESPALLADGQHARADAYVSLAVVGSAIAVALGASVLDPLIGLAITVVILGITRHSWQTIRATEGEGFEPSRRVDPA